MPAELARPWLLACPLWLVVLAPGARAAEPPHLEGLAVPGVLLACLVYALGVTVRRRGVTAVLAGLLLVVAARSADGTVFHARDEALKLAFPDADRTEARDFFLTAAEHSEIERYAKSKLESDMLTVYVGFQGERRLGYALFDTHVVRTLPETFLVVLSPDGRVEGTHVLAFYEPLEYLPGQRWLAQFREKPLDDDLQVGHGIVAITGSTLTSHAVTGGIRRALAIYRVLLERR